jgi:hypothetical protein
VDDRQRVLAAMTVEQLIDELGEAESDLDAAMQEADLCMSSVGNLMTHLRRAIRGQEVTA